MAKKIRVGDSAPEFDLRDQHGATVRLGDFKGKKVVVLYFYPKDDTPGCTAQACTFRDQYQDFTDAGAVVIGVSSNGVNSHRQFAQEHSLPFSILSDHKDELRNKYGARHLMGLMPGRITYVIDKNGTVRHVFNFMFNPKKHIEASLNVIRSMR